jgi:chromosomal replication initiator protein
MDANSQPTTLDELWEGVLAEIELAVSKATFNTWFKDTYIIREKEGVVSVGVPNEFVKTWLAEKHHKTILRLLRDRLSTVRSVEYAVGKRRDDAGDRRREDREIGNRLPLKDFYIDKKDNLNPRYTFESFVVGPFNELAYAAAQAVIKSPGTAYNPLFVYGKSGHGKTHLIQAIGNYLKNATPGLSIYYLTSEKFAMDYTNSIKSNNVHAFKEKYRKYDVLIMDDVQFFGSKEKTQEELFHLFNTLHDANKQIVFSSDMHPNYLSNMEERLRSRFSAGMIVDIPAPDKESRFAILETKAGQSGVPISYDVIDLLASSIEGNIRELEGALNSIIVQTQLKERELSVNEAKSLIRNNMKTKKTVAIKDIVRVVADFYNIDEELIHKKTRKKEIVKPRQVIMYILREDFNMAYPTIGQKLGGRDHTTVIHSYEKVKEDLKTDSALAQDINQIRAML